MQTVSAVLNWYSLVHVVPYSQIGSRVFVFCTGQEYVANKTKKTEERRKAIEDINAVIQQIYRDQDLTQGRSHFPCSDFLISQSYLKAWLETAA